MKKQTGKLIKATKYEKEIKYIRGYFIEMKDTHGQVIYTFLKKKEADQFFKEVIKPR